MAETLPSPLRGFIDAPAAPVSWALLSHTSHEHPHGSNRHDRQTCQRCPDRQQRQQSKRRQDSTTQRQLTRRYETDALLGFGREGRWLIVQRTHRIALRREDWLAAATRLPAHPAVVRFPVRIVLSSLRVRVEVGDPSPFSGIIASALRKRKRYNENWGCLTGLDLAGVPERFGWRGGGFRLPLSAILDAPGHCL